MSDVAVFANSSEENVKREISSKETKGGYSYIMYIDIVLRIVFLFCIFKLLFQKFKIEIRKST